MQPSSSEQSRDLAFRLRRRLVKLGKKARPWTNARIAAGSLVGDHAIFPRDTFPWIAELESEWKRFRDEAAGVLAERGSVPPLRRISVDHERIAPGDAWRSYFLYGYGYRRDAACACCPETARAVERIPGLESAFFSILAPGAALKPHKGPTKALLTCHVPLWVPEERGRCYIEVDGQRHVWKPGEVFLFDDTCRHEVRNDTDQERVVLLIHVRRPTTGLGRVVSTSFLQLIKWSPFVREARRSLDAWDAAHPADAPRHS
ncbi:MAG: aspartyl/asparaginyl beta-hydroxylase domain-containing protein [Pseudomonadota bacterium]